MKKILFALLALLGALTFAPKAEAGQYVKYWNGRGYDYVHKSEAYGRNYGRGYDRGYDRRYRDHHYRDSRRVRYYQRPVRHYYSSPYRYSRTRYYSDRHYSPRYYSYSSRPRVFLSFGF